MLNANPLDFRHDLDVPIQLLFRLTLPILTTTQTAHDVNPYTNTRGKYVAKVQHPRSILRAHLRAVAIALACMLVFVILEPIQKMTC